MCQLIDKEGLSIDVSTGESFLLFLKAAMTFKSLFHGNNKSLEEIKYGIKNKVGCFIVDNFEELNNLDKIAGKFGVKQEIMIRVTPGFMHLLMSIFRLVKKNLNLDLISQVELRWRQLN